MPDVSTDSIFKLAEEFVQSRSNSNNLAKMIQHLENHDELDAKLTNCCILGLQTMFAHSLPVTKANSGSKAAELEYRTWLLKMFEKATEILKNILRSPKYAYPVREQAMVTYVHLLKMESLHVSKPSAGDVFCLPKTKFLSLLKALVVAKKSKIPKNKVQIKLMNRFAEFSGLHDVALQIWVTCVSLTKCEKKVHDETKMKNILYLLGKTAVPTLSLREQSPEELMFPGNIATKKFAKNVPLAVDGVWNNIRKWHHTKATMHETLLLLLEKIMDNLKEPQFLTDFLMKSLEFGGALSLLSLQGIFDLIQKHNIEYPNVYKKLYSLFTPDILLTKYKQRLFYLADLFLTSSHLPESLVAAFAKRLGRLALTAATTDVLIIVPFIGNLLIRHKGLQKMVHNTDGGFVESDPYLEDEPDPASSRAIESCLWELKSLQSHLVPSVAIAARFIEEPLPSVEWDLAQVLEITYSETFNKEVKKKAKDLSLNFIPPTPEVLEKFKRTF